MKQQVYHYQVILSNSTLVNIFLIYNQSRLEKDVLKNDRNPVLNDCRLGAYNYHILKEYCCCK